MQVNDFLIVYALQHLFFFAYAVYMLAKFSPDVARKDEYAYFRALIIEYLFFLVISILWSLAEHGVYRIPDPLFWVLSIIDMGNLATIGYILSVFIMIRVAPELFDNKFVRYCLPIPYLIEIGGLILSVWTHWMISVAPGNRMIYEDGFLVFVLCSHIYFLALIVICLIRMKQAKSDAQKRLIRTLLVAIILIIACAAGDNAFEAISILPIAVFGVLYVIFINMQESSINSDQLTGMNNRRKAADFVSETLSGVSPERPLHLYMIDINAFKLINDTYGHSEGDQALIILAQSIKRIAPEFNAFAARLGGDEFLFACSLPEDTDPNLPIQRIREAVQSACETQGKPYLLSISSGYSVCDDPSVSFTQYLKEADNRMYKNKEQYYREQGSGH